MSDPTQAELAALTPAEMVQRSRDRHPSGGRLPKSDAEQTNPYGRRLPPLVRQVLDEVRAQAQEADGGG